MHSPSVYSFKFHKPHKEASRLIEKEVETRAVIKLAEDAAATSGLRPCGQTWLQ